jgi:hypothetical protein
LVYALIRILFGSFSDLHESQISLRGGDAIVVAARNLDKIIRDSVIRMSVAQNGFRRRRFQIGRLAGASSASLRRPIINPEIIFSDAEQSRASAAADNI